MPEAGVLEVLLHPFATGALAWPAQGAVAFASAQVLPGLDAAQRAQLRCEQWFKPLAAELARTGHAFDDGEAGLPLALVLPPRQRDHARALLARALRRLPPGGVLVACQANEAGAKSLQ